MHGLMAIPGGPVLPEGCPAGRGAPPAARCLPPLRLAPPADIRAGHAAMREPPAPAPVLAPVLAPVPPAVFFPMPAMRAPVPRAAAGR